MASRNTIWIYDEDRKSFRQVDRNRVDFNYPHNPENRVRFSKGRGNHCYVAYGETIEEVAHRYNCYTNEEIAKLEVKIAALRDRLLKP